MDKLTHTVCIYTMQRRNEKKLNSFYMWIFLFKNGKSNGTIYFFHPMSLFISILLWAASWQNQQNERAHSKDSDQPGHLPSLIRVFAVRMKKAWVLSYPLSAHSDQTGWMPKLIWVFAGRTLILLVLSCRGSYMHLRLAWQCNKQTI